MRNPKPDSGSNPLAGLAFAWRNRHLLSGLTRREITGRYRGSWLGVLWSLITPLLLLGIYIFIFGVVFRVRWGEGQALDGQFAAILFCGVILHGILSEVLTRSPVSIVGNVNFVKKVVFPLELLAWVTVLSALFHFILALVVLFAFMLFTGYGIPVTALAFPLVLIPFLLVTLGVAWFVSSLGVYVRDVSQVTGFLATALLFLSPIFYPLSAVPERFRDLFLLNPLTHVIIESRNVLMMGQWPDPGGLLVYWLVAIAVFWLGYVWFQRTRGGFADVL
jgi:lipopolysaccharide transport system permease protein